jgi:hypothetical protein
MSHRKGSGFQSGAGHEEHLEDQITAKRPKARPAEIFADLARSATEGPDRMENAARMSCPRLP